MTMLNQPIHVKNGRFIFLNEILTGQRPHQPGVTVKDKPYGVEDMSRAEVARMFGTHTRESARAWNMFHDLRRRKKASAKARERAQFHDKIAAGYLNELLKRGDQ